MKIKKSLLIIFPLFLFILIFYSFFNNKNFFLTLKKITIGKNQIFVEIADTPAKREKGLSQRDFLPRNQGMLFIFEKPGYYGFWMKGMRFSLDFIWIRDDRIVDITKNIKPEDFQLLKLIYPKVEVDKVLEVNGGMVDYWKIKLGEKLSF